MPQPHAPLLRTRRAAIALAVCALAACGGGQDAATNSATNSATAAATPQAATPANQPGILAAATTAPVGTLSLVSLLASGGGAPCAISASGDLVAYVDNSSGRNQVRLRNLATGSLVLASTQANGSPILAAAVCRGMSPDGRYLVLDVAASSGSPDSTAPLTDAALYVKDLQTGALQRATPQLNTLPTTRAFQFVGLSHDGQRLAFLGLPTTTYLGGYQTVANGPTRLLLQDLAANRLVDLTSTARLATTTGPAEPGTAALSPDGQRLAFVSAAPFPEVGDTDDRNDVLVLNLQTGSLSLGSPDTPATAGFSWSRLQGFAQGGSRLIYQGGPPQQFLGTGLYANTLATGTVALLAGRSSTDNSYFGGANDETLAFDDALRQVVFLRSDSRNRFNQPWLRQLATGSEQRLDSTATGVLGNSFSTAPLISADGTQTSFGSFATNLVRLGRTAPTFQTYRKTVGVAAVVTQ